MFSTRARVEFYLDETTNPQDLAQRVSRFRYDEGLTNIADALDLSRRELFGGRRGDRPDSPNILILITDGKPNEQEGDTINFANAAKRGGISIITVGITNDIDVDQLLRISSNGQVLTVGSFSNLQLVLVALLRTTCNVDKTGKYSCLQKIIVVIFRSACKCISIVFAF